MKKIDKISNVKPIFLIGFMACGKTTFGKLLAKHLGYAFIDTDLYIEEKEGMTISEIFEQKGEAFFRQLEHETIKVLSNGANTIIATGGGAPCFYDNISVMNAAGYTCYLQLEPAKIALRLRGNSSERPLVASKTEEELLAFIESKLTDRDVFYKQANFIIDADEPELFFDYIR